MGFYLRKSLRVGPLRFNLSKSGIGLSTGIKGFRVGTGPRGNYVHMGRHGIYYRKTFSTDKSTKPRYKDSRQQSQDHRQPVGEHIEMEEIESGDVLSMTDSSSRELLEELNSKQKKWRLLPASVIISILALILIVTKDLPGWLIIITAIIFSGLDIFAYYRDQLKKSVVLFYDFEPVLEKEYQSFHDAYDNLRSCKKIWHIEAEGDIKDRKYHAGANKAIKRKQIALTKSTPPFVKTNISIPTIPVGRQTLYFFPDRILVYDANGVGAVGYDMVNINISATKFIEDEYVPGDSQVVDRTWRYVNKKGGPDKRFKDNREIPVVLYDEIHFTSETGLNEMLQLSRVGSAIEFKEHMICLQPQKHSSK